MPWLKYDSKPILLGEHWTRSQEKVFSKYAKPNGFWITDDTEDCWRQFCTSNNFGLERLTHKHEIDLDESRVLILREPWEVHTFGRQYRAFHTWGPPEDIERYTDVCVDWMRVAADYDGLIITPYQWSLRMADDFSWYYCWDCSSGCIWNPRAILDIRLVEIDLDIAKHCVDREAA